MPEARADLPRPGARKTARAALIIGIAAASLLYLWATTVRVPWLAAYEEQFLTGQRGKLYLPRGLLGAGLSLVVGAMAGTVIAILLLNRHRLKNLFRPTAGKLIAIILLGLLVPIGLFSILPINALSLLRMLPDMGVAGPNRAVVLARIWAQILTPLAVCAVIVPPVIYGIRNRGLRVALLFGVWIAGYALQVLLNGLYIGPINL